MIYYNEFCVYSKIFTLILLFVIQIDAFASATSAFKNCFTTKLGKLIENYQNELNQGRSTESEKRLASIMTTTVENVYLRSPDMQMLLNLLAEKEGMWSAILILSIFDSSFKNEFKVRKTLR